MIEIVVDSCGNDEEEDKLNIILINTFKRYSTRPEHNIYGATLLICIFLFYITEVIIVSEWKLIDILIVT